MSTRIFYVSMKNRNVGFRPHNGPKDPNQTIFKVYVKEGEVGSVRIPTDVFDNAVFMVDADSRVVISNSGKLIRDDQGQPATPVDMLPLPVCSDQSFQTMLNAYDKQKDDFAISIEALVAEFVQD